MNTILVIDDDMFFRDQMGNYLKKEGYSVLALDNAKEAVKALSQDERKFQVVVLDVYMKGMNGDQAASIIRNLQPAIPIIIVTGDPSLDLERRMRNGGAFSYLVKPFDLKEFGAIVKSAIKKYRADATPGS